MQAEQEAAGENSPIYLPVSAVAEILYCPRNFYYRMVEGADDSNAHLLEGRLQEDRRNERERLVRETSLQIRSVTVSSERLHLLGVIDALEERGELYPVEYKKGVRRDNLNDDVQLCAQAMALEEHLGRELPRGFIYYAGSHARREVHFTADLRALVENTVHRAMAILEAGEIPLPLGDNRCHGCALEPRCLPEETKYLRGEGQRPSRPLPGLNPGRVLYVDQPGAYVRRKGQRLLVTMEKETMMDMPLCNIDQVVLVGGVNISTPVIKLLLENGTPVSFLSTGGSFRGVLEPALNRNSTLRLAQYGAYFDGRVRLMLARQFVRGKLTNMRVALMRHNRELHDPEISLAVRRMAGYIAAAGEATELSSLLGLEGIGSREYFRVFGRLIRRELPFVFEGRNRRPPRDPVNAMLGYCYSLLTRDMRSAAALVGFDPYLGFFHEAKYGRPALALDLMEEFRPIVADSVVLAAINRGTVTESDFEQRLGGCYLNDAGRAKIYRAYEEKRQQQITHPVFGYRLPYRRVFELQARFLAKVLQKELDGYIPFVVK
ncbi:CRISPR-associated endonuclease Cas4/Cas1 [Desulfotomaculum copahuensis]|uniref:CRISPR-associated endonuclease Cas1 n=1 Tax=Desulfotomaculum copahuensis TaxID=1838280 RepID=A0A1B7LCF5_9FIRM|nr:CRISPR-associated endonuclease Cas4/Cas1 [Desulfotomaculum copahuensis]OAT80403.1 CRISPR-associated endonuclease Cas4/Cas1 [Desulfotomaculum copahuensis]